MSSPRYDDGRRAVYTLRQGGESQTVVVCERHGEQMPLIDGESVTAEPGEAGLRCDFCSLECPDCGWRLTATERAAGRCLPCSISKAGGT